MIVLFRYGKCVGKTRPGLFEIPSDLTVEEFSSANPIHCKAKFLQHPPKEAIQTENLDIYTVGDFLFDLLGYMEMISHDRIMVDGKFQTYSRSGIKRLFEQKCVQLNGEVICDQFALFLTCESLVLFPNSSKRTTIF